MRPPEQEVPHESTGRPRPAAADRDRGGRGGLRGHRAAGGHHHGHRDRPRHRHRDRPRRPLAPRPAPDRRHPGPRALPGPEHPAGASPVPRETLIAGHYHPLWPFSDPGQVAAWQREYRANGRERWRLDPARTAVAFSRDFLGFTDIDRAVKTVRDGAHARVHVGFRAEEGPRPLVVAVVHLMRYGQGKDAPWEVVGTDDTTLSLTRPAYGAAARSPLTVGGRVTGVDESLRIEVRHPSSRKPLGERCCLPAGGQNAPWSGRVSFTAPPGRTLTVVVSTGGHVAAVERFAVTAVTVPR
ncbi:hypothetical protein [Nonomuraea candida]|uniref:hypothetical protein n=1 Tax=Nonomuraea candida TaxID=359159 RepID=UPI0006944D47|nr:hypothetical protein [Nonomuraea candida]